MKVRFPISMLAAITLALACTGCSMGGGTIGTGVTSLGNGVSHQSLSFILSLKVQDSKGRPLSNGRISLSNSAGNYSGVTNKDGIIQLKLTMVSGESFSINLSSKGKTYQVQEFISPAGRQQVSATIALSSAGEIEFIESE